MLESDKEYTLDKQRNTHKFYLSRQFFADSQYPFKDSKKYVVRVIPGVGVLFHRPEVEIGTTRVFGEPDKTFVFCSEARDADCVNCENTKLNDNDKHYYCTITGALCPSKKCPLEQVE